ncbi:unnamed protein product [Ectocarpus sp. 8 AP-2014]
MPFHKPQPLNMRQQDGSHRHGLLWVMAQVRLLAALLLLLRRLLGLLRFRGRRNYNMIRSKHAFLRYRTRLLLYPAFMRPSASRCHATAGATRDVVGRGGE